MKRKQKTNKHAPLQGSVRGYIREISVAMFLQIQTDPEIWNPLEIYKYKYIHSLSSAFLYQKKTIFASG